MKTTIWIHLTDHFCRMFFFSILVYQWVHGRRMFFFFFQVAKARQWDLRGSEPGRETLDAKLEKPRQTKRARDFLQEFEIFVIFSNSKME